MADPDTVLLVPAEGRRVIDPATRQPVPAEGVGVPLPLSTYWRRRIADGDVAEAPAAPQRGRKTTAAPAAEGAE